MKNKPQPENLECTITYVWKQGYPTGTDPIFAIENAEATARANGVENEVITSEIVETEEHIANNEILVVLRFGIRHLIEG